MSRVPANIFREYDIRGIAEEELTPEVVRLIGQAYGTFLKAQGFTRMTVGGDVRLSTERIKANIVEGANAAGIHQRRPRVVGAMPAPFVPAGTSTATNPRP